MPLGIATDPKIDVSCLKALWRGEGPSQIAKNFGLPSSTQVCRNAGREALRLIMTDEAVPPGPGPIFSETGALRPGGRCDASKGDAALEMKLAGDTLTVICSELGWRYEGAASTAISRAAIRRLSTIHEE